MAKIDPVTMQHSEDILKCREWTGNFISDPSALPISFVLDEKVISGIPEDWQPTSSRRRIDANISETVFEGDDVRTGLKIQVEFIEYHDYPVVEWVAMFTNNGHEKTPVIHDVLAMDGTFNGSLPVLHYSNGDFNSVEDYMPYEVSLNLGSTYKFSPNGGRPCEGVFPYYRVEFEGCGLSIAIGWPGQWAADFMGLEDGIRIRAGQEKTNLRLMPSECIRTPRITILSWAGNTSRAVNLWRRWYLDHILPRPDGQPLKPLLACYGTDDGAECTATTEENQIRYMEKAKRHGIHFDVWWIDAGWYDCYNEKHERDWYLTGTWEPDPKRFPNGLKIVSECASRNGADLLLWFEPERVYPVTQIDVEYPQWLLKIEGTDNSLLDLGNPECRKWITDHVCRLIRDNGVKIYRQDYNIRPLEYWRQNEAEDRQGINENLYIQGYLQFWDELLMRNPGLWIDSCSSGGRRNDLETMRRSVPLHYTDYGYGENPAKLAFHSTLFEWLPYFKEFTLTWDIGEKQRFDNQVDSYSYHCGMAPMLFATMDIRRDDYDYALAQRMIEIWRRASELILYGDYYTHTQFYRSIQKWVVWQFDRPEIGYGLLQGIRLPESLEDAITIYPEGICRDKIYFFENVETDEKKDIPGHTLIKYGFMFSLPKRSGAIWFYKRK